MKKTLILFVAVLAILTARAETVWSVSYIDANGNQQTAARADVVTTNMQGLDNYNFRSAYDWLYVKNDVTLEGAWNGANGTLNLILGDGATLTINGQFKISAGSLNIYCQSGGTGKLVVSGSYDGGAIFSVRNTLTINGGTVEATNSTSYSVYALFANLVMNGGSASFTCNKGSNAYAISGNVTLNNGSFTARCGSSAPTASGTLRIGDGKYYKDNSNPANYYAGTLTNEQKKAINGKTLQPGTQAEYVVASLGADNDGSADHPYMIRDANGWNAFCLALEDEDTWHAFSGKTVKLGADINVNRMAGVTGTTSHPFSGTFDGDGKTLTFNYTASDNYAAPFAFVKGGSTAATAAAITHLNVASTITASGYRHMGGLISLQQGHVNVTDCHATVNINSTTGGTENNLYPAALVSQSAPENNGTLTLSGCTASGTIALDGKYAGGLIGIVQGSANVVNCVSSVTIKSSTAGDGTHGGLIASHQRNNGITIDGCLFNGKLLTVGATATGNCGGFIGWRNGIITIKNSLYAPAELESGETEVVAGSDATSSHTFYRNDAAAGDVITNCYYTRTLGTAQGKQRHSITAGDYVTVANAGTPDAFYSVSGITAYPTGIKYNDVLYAGNEDEVALTLGYNGNQNAFLGYEASAGTLSGSNNPYTLTMPDEDVAITANMRYTFDSATGELVLISGEFNKNNKWGADVPEAAVTSVTATSDVSFTGDCTELFYNFSNCKSMRLNNVNTSNVNNMASLFAYCSSLKTLEISNWNTGNVTNMYRTFMHCDSLTTLNVSNWNTANVTNMNSTFSQCMGVETLDVSNWNTGNVTTMQWMFNYCTSLKTLDLSKWDTGKLTDMRSVFSHCESLTTLDLSNWDTRNVTAMGRLFMNCESLTSVNVTNWNTSSVTDMKSMFSECLNLKTLDLSDWNTGNVTEMQWMFYRCGKQTLTTIYVGSGWNTDKVTSSFSMFVENYSLQGDMGSTYSWYGMQDKEFAHFDKGEDDPGYLTGVFTLTLPEDVDTTAVATLTHGDVNLYKARTTVTLSYSGEVPEGYVLVYSVNGTAIEGDTFTMPYEDVTVTVNFEKPQVLGDLNGDGMVDVTDVSQLINVVLGKTVELAEGAVCDLNSDGNVDVTDVSLLIDIVLGK